MRNPLRFLTSIFVGDRYEWRVPVPIDEAARMFKSCSENSWYTLRTAPRVTLEFKGTKFVLRRPGIVGIPLSGNSFSHELHGNLEASDGTTIIRARFRLPGFAIAFSTVWLSLSTFGATAFLTQAIHRATSLHCFPSLLNLVPVLLPAGGCLMLHFGLLISRPNRRDILARMNEIVGIAKRDA